MIKTLGRIAPQNDVKVNWAIWFNYRRRRNHRHHPRLLQQKNPHIKTQIKINGNKKENKVGNVVVRYDDDPSNCLM